MRVGWMLIPVQFALMTYALRAVCWQIGRDRRCPSRDRIMALRGAYWCAVAIMAYALLMQWDADGRRFKVVMDYLYLGCVASSFTASLAIRILRGDGPR